MVSWQLQWHIIKRFIAEAQLQIQKISPILEDYESITAYIYILYIYYIYTHTYTYMIYIYIFYIYDVYIYVYIYIHI